MSRFNVMPRTIELPDIPEGDYAFMLVDSEGNYAAVSITRAAIDMAEPAALGHVLANLVAKLDDLT